MSQPQEPLTWACGQRGLACPPWPASSLPDLRSGLHKRSGPLLVNPAPRTGRKGLVCRTPACTWHLETKAQLPTPPRSRPRSPLPPSLFAHLRRWGFSLLPLPPHLPGRAGAWLPCCPHQPRRRLLCLGLIPTWARCSSQQALSPCLKMISVGQKGIAGGQD